MILLFIVFKLLFSEENQDLNFRKKLNEIMEDNIIIHDLTYLFFTIILFAYGKIELAKNF